MSVIRRLSAAVAASGCPLALSGLLLAVTGCVTSLVPQGAPVTLTEAQRAALRAFPDRPYEMSQSVVFTLRGRNFPGFGMTRVSPSERRFAASCLTAQGMTVFDIAGEGERLDVCRTLPGVGDPKAVGEAFARNVRSIYFDDRPAPDASWWRDGDCWIALSALPEGGTLRHRFACATGQLKEKSQFTRRGTLAWTASFEDYDENGPRRIELRDRTLRWPYTLTVRVKAWLGK